MYSDQYLSIDGSEIFVREIHLKAKHPLTIVFLHDSLGCVTLWRDLPEKLVRATGMNALLYDRKGYGKSTGYHADDKRKSDYMADEADLLHVLLKKLAIGKCILFGHSDGATIALLAAAKYPDIVQGLIISGPHIYVEPITQKGVAETYQAYYATDMKQRLEKYHGERTDALVNIWADIWLSESFSTWNIKREISSIACPMLIIQGEEDEFGTLQQVYDIVNLVDGKCDILIIPDAGHTPYRAHGSFILDNSITFLTDILSENH
ncbi:MAG: alpha/beta hydrolase [Cyclobacteriaceae bacterium]